MKYVIATHNAHKLIELQRILEPLGIEGVTDRDLGIELPEVEETGTTFAENAYLKAASACHRLACHCRRFRRGGGCAGRTPRRVFRPLWRCRGYRR